MKDHPEKLSLIGYVEQLACTKNILDYFYTSRTQRYALQQYILHTHPDLTPSRWVIHDKEVNQFVGLMFTCVATFASVVALTSGSVVGAIVIVACMTAMASLYLHFVREEKKRIDQLQKELGFTPRYKYWDSWGDTHATSCIQSQKEEGYWDDLRASVGKLVLHTQMQERVLALINSGQTIHSQLGNGSNKQVVHYGSAAKDLYHLVEKAANYTEMNSGEQEEFEALIVGIESCWLIKELVDHGLLEDEPAQEKAQARL